MIALAYYLLKIIICSGLLFLYYHIALRNKLFHQWNRFYLLAVVLLSLIIPLLQFTFIHYGNDPGRAIRLLQAVQSADTYMEEISISNSHSMSTEQWLGIGYTCVSALILLLMIQSFLKIRSIIRRHNVQLVNEIKFVATQEQGTPFTFFSYIFWNDKIDIHSVTGQQIFQHELVHVKEAHTFDKLFMQVLLIVFWCNPFFWLIRRELQLVHEFIADQKAVQQHDTATLAAMILQAAYPHQFSQITNQFFQSSIKRRLLMLTKIQNPRINYLSRILALPLVAITVLAFTFRTKSSRAVIPLEKDITVVIDAGHGQVNGTMTGARAEQVYEDAIVLALAKKIKEVNANEKVHIVLTRTSNEIVDLHKRVDIAREKKADLFISIHTAAASNGKEGSGIEILVSNKNTPFQKQSELLGSALKEELNSIYPTQHDLIKRKVGTWVLDQNICPSVLIECGYITDKKDRAFISNEANQKLIAEKILNAIERYAAVSGPFAPATSLLDTVPNRNVQDINKSNIDKPKNEATLTYTDGSTETTQMNKPATKKLNVKPIYFVDGKEFQGDINKLDPTKIESINVLKDQAAVNKYGEKGKNGVIEIFTKQGNKTDLFDTVPRNTPVFEKAETQASIDSKEWRTFLQEKLQPLIKEVSKTAPQGKYTVLLQFIVEKDGRISNIKPVRNPGYNLGEKITALMQQSPKWKPAIQNGQPVRSYHTQPITLVITHDKESSKSPDTVSNPKT